MRDFIFNAIPYILVFIFFMLLIGLFVSIYEDCVAEKFELRKDEWVCTQKTKKIIYVFNAATKTTMPQVVEECTQWSKVEVK